MDDHHLSLTPPGPSDMHHLDHPLNLSFGLNPQAVLASSPVNMHFHEAPPAGKDPLYRFVRGNDGPWHPRNLTGIEVGGGQPMASSMRNGQFMFPIPSNVVPSDIMAPSDSGKHDQRHKKPFKCDVKDCPRGNEGFSTTNDLDRHKRSVHPGSQTSGTFYQCRIHDCKNKKKIWPRADNFKAHLKRVHSQDNLSEEDLEACIVKQPAQPTPLDEPQDNPPREAMSECHEYSGLPNGQTNDWSSFSEMPHGMNSLGPLRDAQAERHLSLSNPQQELADLNIHHTAPRQELYQEITEPDLTSHSAIALSSPVQHDQLTRESETLAATSSPLQEHMAPVLSANTQANDAGSSPFVLSSEPSEPIASNSPALDLPDHMVKRDSGAADFAESKDFPTLNLINLDHINTSDMVKLVDALQTLQSRGVLEQLGYRKEGSETAEPVKIDTDTALHPNQCHRCSTCPKTFHRRCELKKHEKRHEKPYGCTMPDCDKKFGSKNDWKRHENTQHFMLEIWRCDKEGCGRVCYRREIFKSHLEKDHQVIDQNTLEVKLEKCRVGRNCEARFWCGFCQEIIEIKQEGGQAWAERFDHIDEHFSGRNRAQKEISEWKDFDASQQSKESLKEDSDASVGSVQPQHPSRHGTHHPQGHSRSKRKRDDGNNPDNSKKTRVVESQGVDAGTW
ncbi:hypothetical protein NUW58_g526 [Xylaria curta]|uniref:Uncharacterized protein n=1 Tax=Xylaria curta TaxID=42375 RepID=A0ACC1PRW5_9PEZI|nr:hypothetical protein NUW58_g526 [Xylaria curta]